MDDEYPQLQIIPTLHRVDDTNQTLIPFVMVNIREDYVFLPKGQVVGFLDSECIDVSEIELHIASVTVNAMDTPTTITEKIIKTDQCDIPSDFITSPADAAGPHKAHLQDLEVWQKRQKLLTNYVGCMPMCFLTILVILVEHH